MNEERFEKINEMLDGFSFGMKQDLRSMLSILIMRKVSNAEYIEYVNMLILKSLYESAVSPFINPSPKLRPFICPDCGDVLTYRVVRGNKLGYRSNFVCDECGLDHYDKRSVPEVLNEGIRVNVPPKFDEGTTAEPVVSKE